MGTLPLINQRIKPVPGISFHCQGSTRCGMLHSDQSDLSRNTREGF